MDLFYQVDQIEDHKVTWHKLRNG